MELATNTGWRKMAPPLSTSETIEGTKKDLFECAHMAVKALHLRPAARFVLSQLVGFFKEPMNGMYLVWPSNEFLSERTGLSDRTIRYAIRELVMTGLIRCKDSANGKRFAIRSKSGQILDAFGFDLAPILAIRESLVQKCAELTELRRIRDAKFQEITICRRASLEAISEIRTGYPEIDVSSLVSEFDRLCALTPRKGSSAPIDTALELWRGLHQASITEYQAAYDGKNCRHIENIKDSPDQSCYKRQGDNDGEITVSEIYLACPDAMSYAQPVRNADGLLAEAQKLRGAFGTHRSAFDEAIEQLGSYRAAAAFFVVLEIYCIDQRDKQAIKNFGGYFRNYVRMIAAGSVDLSEVVRFMRRRRNN